MRGASRESVVIGLIIAVHALSAPADAQQPRRIELKPPTATHPEEFTAINSIRELRDGRLVVAEGREQRLVTLDFSTGASAPVGRSGKGPNEYSMVSFVHAVAGDSSVMPDFMGKRYLVFDGPRIVVTVPPDHPAMVVANKGFIAGADAIGNLLVRIEPPRRDGLTETGVEDSAALVRVARTSGRADTIARTRNVPRRIEITRGANDVITASSSFVRGPLLTEEQALLYPDGALAVARLDPFRVDWRAPSGAWTRGAPLPLARVRVDARERAAYRERTRANAAQAANLPAAARSAFAPEDSDFPEFVPPFPSTRALVMGPRGLLFILRAKSADIKGNHYLVIDRRGQLLGEVALPLERTILGSGEGSIYVGVKDEDDVLRIQRHPWP